MNEDRLRALFDYQRFAGNTKLGRMIVETKRKYQGKVELCEDEEELITAACGINNEKKDFPGKDGLL